MWKYEDLSQNYFFSEEEKTFFLLPAGHGFMFRVGIGAGENQTVDILHQNKRIVIK